jgi:probable HAF family extracellular repeat protein
MSGHALRATVVVALAFLLSPISSAFAGDWTVGEITGPVGTTRIIPAAVNADGVVVGTARFAGRDRDTAFRWEDGMMIELALPGGMTYSYAKDINDKGVIVGFGGMYHDCCATSTNGIVWSSTKTTSSFSLTSFSLYIGAYTTSGDEKTYGSVATGINEQGQIVGRAGYKQDDGPPFGVWRNYMPTVGSGGGWSRLPLPDTANTTYAGSTQAINDNGAILGTGGGGGDRARLWNAPAPYPIEILAGDQGLNNLNHVAGSTVSSSAHRARLWDGSKYVEIGANQPLSMANAVNDSDWAVGRAGTEDWQNPLTAGNAWLWRPDEAPTPLYALAGTGWSMYSAFDINEDGMIVGTGKHGSSAVGFWMAPASIAHKLTGTVYGVGGAPAAGVTVRVVGGAGEQVAAPVTGADGTYSVTLPRASYAITALPDGSYLPNGVAGCTIVASTCQLNLGGNRTVDFYATAIVVPVVPPADTGTPAPPTGSGPAPADKAGPVVTVPATKTLAVKAGAVSFTLGPFTEPVKGSVALRTEKKVAAAVAKPKLLALGSATFTAAPGKKVTVKIKLAKSAKALLKQRKRVKAVATVTARDAAGNTTTKTLKLTVKAR